MFLSDKKILILDRTFHRVLVATIYDESPNLREQFLLQSENMSTLIKLLYAGISSSHFIEMPISNIAVLSGMMIAGLVRTRTKTG